MSAGSQAPRHRREGWPWPDRAAGRNESTREAAERASADALVAAAALGVAKLSDELRLAVLRLEDAQREASLVAECAAAWEANRLLARIRRSTD